MASAGCKNIPPFRNSNNIMGFAAASSPNTRRISGGKVMVPRLETEIAVILQYCNATSILASANFHREAN
jgi:hypothetical protein